MPSWQLISIYESLCEMGSPFGLRDFGGQAFNSMRLEKMYRAYGAEFTEEISALEAGMDRFLDLSRNFIGSEVKDYQWLEWNVDGLDVTIENLTEEWGGLLLTGPDARNILSQCTQEDLSNTGFSWLSCKTIKIDSASLKFSYKKIVDSTYNSYQNVVIAQTESTL